MRNIKLVLAYDGTEFAGWQIQPNAPTIQGTLAQAIEKLTNEKELPQASGRSPRKTGGSAASSPKPSASYEHPGNLALR